MVDNLVALGTVGRLDEWGGIKKSIEISGAAFKSIFIGRIYWVSVGQNIGREIFGNGGGFCRPVLVLKIFKMHGSVMFLGVPLSTKTRRKNGAIYFHFSDTNGDRQVALLGQMRAFDIKRVKNYHASIAAEDFNRLIYQIRESMFEEIPLLKGREVR